MTIPLNLSVFNTVWLAISISALAWLGYTEISRGGAPLRAGIRRLVAVLILALALFPVISDSDDALSLSFLDNRAVLAPGHASSHQGVLQLVWLLDSLEHYQPAQVRAFVMLLLWVAVITALALRPAGRAVACRGGRSPPSPSLCHSL